MLAEAQSLLDADAPGNEWIKDAAGSYREVITLHPGNPAATNGLEQLRTRALQLVEQQLEEENIDGAGHTSLSLLDSFADDSAARDMRVRVEAEA